MNDFLTLDDLSYLIMVKHDMTREDSDKFVNSFFSIIKEGLLSDRYVRVKGFGTFKLIEDGISDKLSSNKIVFLPDTDFKKVVNKPFAHFEPVVLNDDVHFDDIEECVLVENDAVNDKAGNESLVNHDKFDNDKKQELELKENQTEDFEGEYPEKQKVAFGKLYKNMQWQSRLLFLFTGVVVGATVSWLIYKKTGIIDFDNLNLEEEVVAVNPVAGVKHVDTISVAEKVSIGNKQEIDSLLMYSDVAKDKEPAFYSEKYKYKIAGTIEPYEIKKGNTLAKISYKYYKNKKMWPYIVLHNKNLIKDPNNVPIGTKINIPKLELME